MRTISLLAMMVALAGCVGGGAPKSMSDDFLASEVRVTPHHAPDDLLSGGLGLGGLRNPMAPAPADAAAPTPEELRRRALHTNWRGIADLADPAFAELPQVPGREYHAFARVPGAAQPHRVLAQVPDAFDPEARCLVVAPASGSRGVYGAIAVAGAWALPRGCAVAYTDKGAGTGHFDFASDTGVALDGTRAARGSAMLEFEPPASPTAAAALRIAIKHAHSQDNPEADWGRHVIQAAHFGLRALDLAFPAQAPFTPANTRVIALGLSNGGGAVLRAGELDDEGLFDAVVAAAPNLHVQGARPLFDVATEAALYQPCALAAFADGPLLMAPAVLQAVSAGRCASLVQAGLLAPGDPAAQAAEALARLRAHGFTDGAMRAAGINVAFDLWRSIGAPYASAYARRSVDDALCGYGYAAQDPNGAARASTVAERALWGSDGSGLAPGTAIGLLDAQAGGTDLAFAGLRCTRALWEGDTAAAQALKAGVAAVQASGRPRAPLTLIVHGVDDGLVPVAFTSVPYVAAAKASGAALRFWQVPRAQHFDAFLALPTLRVAFVPLLPHAHRAMDHAWAAITEGRAPPPDSEQGVP